MAEVTPFPSPESRTMCLDVAEIVYPLLVTEYAVGSWNFTKPCEILKPVLFLALRLGLGLPSRLHYVSLFGDAVGIVFLRVQRHWWCLAAPPVASQTRQSPLRLGHLQGFRTVFVKHHRKLIEWTVRYYGRRKIPYQTSQKCVPCISYAPYNLTW